MFGMDAVTSLEKISGSVNRWIEYLLFGMGFTMALMVAAQVFFRYALNHSLFWSEEAARFLLVWLTFLGATVAYRRKAHPGVDVLYARMPPFLQKTTTILIHTVSILLSGVMILYGCQFAWFVRMQISPALNLPKWIVFGIIPVSGSIFLIHAITFLTGELSRGHHDN